uniref:Secreted protein n=1 Tax=Odontella aurita TaxID=265563 RepID=A0A6U6GY93_9STRA|mmetsp:Transcript_44141/g.134417  ORF Transcript_44141/g.134417 Transcript_44141/m.134417 type:complete len:122 (+) Transcript_44141:600-965(+)
MQRTGVTNLLLLMVHQLLLNESFLLLARRSGLVLVENIARTVTLNDPQNDASCFSMNHFCFSYGGGTELVLILHGLCHSRLHTTIYFSCREEPHIHAEATIFITISKILTEKRTAPAQTKA